MATSKEKKTRALGEIVGLLFDVPPPDKKINAHPFVQLLDEGWRVSRAQSPAEGYTDFEQKILHVPTDGTPTSERTRFHELAHVKWTPADINPDQIAQEQDVPRAFLNAFEDARVNSKMARALPELRELMEDDGVVGLNDEAMPELLSEAIAAGVIDQQETVEVLAALTVSSTGYGESRKMKKLAKKMGVPTKEITTLVRRVQRPGATFETVQKAAVDLRELLRQPEPPMMPMEGAGDASAGGDGDPGDEQQESQGQPSGGEQQGGQPASPTQPDEGEPSEGTQSKGQGEQGGGEPKPVPPPPVPPKPADNRAVDEALSKVPKPSPLELKPDKFDLIEQPKAGPPIKKAAVPGKGALSKKTYGVSKRWSSLKVFSSETDVAPGIMRLQRPKLTETVVKKMGRPRLQRNDLAGGEIRGIHRLISDEKILRRKAPLRSRRKVGSMIIDTSSSMSISVEEIESILKFAPQVTIALYGSNDADHAYLREHPMMVPNTSDALPPYGLGHLAIVAHKGRRVSTYEIDRYCGGGNVVDEDALRWIARQPGPRVWICDNIVTGMRDMQGPNTVINCAVIAARARVKRFYDVRDFLIAAGHLKGEMSHVEFTGDPDEEMGMWGTDLEEEVL